MTRAQPPTGRRARIIAGFATFGILCGIILLIAGGVSAVEDEEESAVDPTALEVQRALGDARQAERALLDTNYGHVEQHLRRLDERLSDLLDELDDD